MEFLLIFISAIFVNNIILSQFLGICPFLGVSQKVNTSLGMGAAVAFVMTCYNSDISRAVLYSQSSWTAVSADNSLHPCNCSIGSDGGDNS